MLIFDPGMSVGEIKARVDAIAAQQVASEFGDKRHALLFKPGTYGSASQPLNFQVGCYTSVAGLGQSPRDVVINGSINVYNRCRIVDNVERCFALYNFWRSLSNLTINVTIRPVPAATPATSGPSRRPLRCAGSTSTANSRGWTTAPDRRLPAAA